MKITKHNMDNMYEFARKNELKMLEDETHRVELVNFSLRLDGDRIMFGNDDAADHFDNDKIEQLIKLSKEFKEKIKAIVYDEDDK